MDLSSRLLLLLEVAELGSFTKAAELRNVDRSVVSKQISRLEDELKIRVLNRSTRSLSLTGAGQEIVRQAEYLRDTLLETKRLAQTYHEEPRGLLRITCSSYIGRTYINKAALKFRERYPDIEIDIQLEDRVVDLVGEGFDIGFRLGILKDSTLISTQIARNRLMIVAAPSLIDRYGMPKTPEDVEKMPAVIFAASGVMGDKIHYYDRFGQKKLLKFNPVYRTNEDEMLLEAAVSGVGIAPIIACIMDDQILKGELVPILTEYQIIDYGALYALFPHKTSPPKTRLFIEHVKDVIGRDAPIWEQKIPNFKDLYRQGAVQ